MIKSSAGFCCASQGEGKRRRHEAQGTRGGLRKERSISGPRKSKERRLGPTILLTKSTIEKKTKILTQLTEDRGPRTEDLVFDVAKIDADTVNWLSTHPQPWVVDTRQQSANTLALDEIGQSRSLPCHLTASHCRSHSRFSFSLSFAHLCAYQI